MNTTLKSQKVATRGQKQIYEENLQVLKAYSIASILSLLLYLILSYTLLSTSKWDWVGFGFCFILQATALYTMHSMAKCRRNEKGQVVDAGLDLNQPEAFGEYCKDVIILSSFVLIVAMIWSVLFWLLLLMPAYAFYKLWTGLIAPWIFARPEEEDEDDKKIKKRERRLRKA